MMENGIKRFFRYALDVVLELLWPTRCAVCDRPCNDVICPDCKAALKAVDPNLACPKCGAPYGIFQCSECNGQTLSSVGLKELPFTRMSHALILDEAARRIVSAYKDKNERRLVNHISSMISHQISPELLSEEYVVTYIPDSSKAFRRRGFDHAREMAECVAAMSGLEARILFDRPSGKDQRHLTRRDRIRNMQDALKIRQGADIPDRAIIIDDVCTTGATIYAACLALREAGVKEIHAITFAQVMG